MAMCARALALWCAVVAVSAAAAYTVDCNHEYTDCDTELSKLASEDEDLPTPKPVIITVAPTTPATSPTRSTIKTTTTQVTEPPTTTTTVQEPTETELIIEVTESPKPKARLINLNVDELQNFANALHNQTNTKGKKVLSDLSDVNLEDDEDDPRMMNTPSRDEHKGISDKFYTNLQEPFHRMDSNDRLRGSEEVEACRENEVTFKIGDKLDRGCEESCECVPGGIFECSPRCKHPYIRRGRRLNDPLCFESPVDECCSIVACATGNGDPKPEPKADVCGYGNETHPIGSQWHLGCDQICTCESMSVVTCKPRCKPIFPSDKCINVQDPSDACCEVQICDVSQDVHELDLNINSTTSTTTTEIITTRQMTTPTYPPISISTATIPTTTTTIPTTTTTTPTTTIQRTTTAAPTTFVGTTLLPPKEPIGSVKVLQNNTVQVNLIHLNNSEDPIHLLLSSDGGNTFEEVELKYTNLILNLQGGKDYVLKTKETGTKFNFTITTTDAIPDRDDLDMDLKGCWEDGKFYEIGEEFQIGCSHLCECTGNNMRDCAVLVCPNHVGLELMSKGCVRWAPSPPALPPNCCPRTARCLSDGTCIYNGITVPNWSEVPLVLTGCEQRCFCENGELDCQEVCSPLPPVPPQSLRCSPSQRPAPVNISDDDCCKQWGCVSNNAGSENASSYQSYSLKIPVVSDRLKYEPVPIFPTQPTPVLLPPIPPTTMIDLFKKVNPVKSYPKALKTMVTKAAQKVQTIKPPHQIPAPEFAQGDNITVFTLDDVESPYKTLHPEPPMIKTISNWETPPKVPNFSGIFPKSHTSISQTTHSHPEMHVSPKHSDGLNNLFSRTKLINPPSNNWTPIKDKFKLDSFKINEEPFKINPEPFKINQEPFRLNKESFKMIEEPFTLNEEPFKMNPEPFKLNQGPFTNVHQDSIKSNKESYSLSQESFKPNKESYSISQESFKPNKESYNMHYDPYKSKESLKLNQDGMRRVSMSSVDNFNYFLPIHEKRPPTYPYYPSDFAGHFARMTTSPSISYFQPMAYNRSEHVLTRTASNSAMDLHKTHKLNQGKHVTVLKSVELDNAKEGTSVWSKEKKSHLLNKHSSPYDTILLQAVPSDKTLAIAKTSVITTTTRSPSSITLEQLLTQMDLDSEVNRNLGRSADDKLVTAAAGHSQTPIYSQKTEPPFLPTIPPIHYPHDDLPDFEQNNINRPNMDQEISGLTSGLPPGLPIQSFGSSGDSNKKLSVLSIESDTSSSIKMLLGLPPVLVGLRGSVDLRYTDKADEDVSHWFSQVFAPADEVLTTPRLEFRLTGLKPSTTYKVKGKLYLHNLPVAPESDLYTIRTMDSPTPIPIEEKRKQVESRLQLVDVNDTTAHVTWRYFSEDELQFIDGIQVRYRPVGTPIYSMTELLHHSRSTAELHDLRPNSKYEASLVLVPPPRATTELYDPKMIEFTTQPYNDPYNWTVTIETRSIGSEATEITWRGVPSPAERWVRVYRAAHACDPPSHTAAAVPPKEHDYFRLAARDQQPIITISGLQPDMKCRVWLEVFLTNGKVKTSNVIEIKTKALDSINQIDNAIEASSVSGSKEEGSRSPRGDYYTALVGVGVVAALGALASLLLLLVVLRRHRPRSVPITPVPSAPRESSLPPYDNPAYKLELQQETMDL